MIRYLIALGLVVGMATGAYSQTREQKVREDKKKAEASGYWHYNNLDKGIAQAKTDNKPIIVVLRCLPCEECVKLDDELVESDPRVKPLLEKFVRVRIVGTNGLDLSLFQFDFDQSFAVFFLNADGTIYGRYGTRSHRTHWADDVSIEGLARAMEGALDLHQNYPANREALKDKRGAKPTYATPESFPLHQGKYTSKIDYEGKVVQSCIHCHQIGDAIRQDIRSQKLQFPDEILFPYPHPKTVGLIMDPRQSGGVREVIPDSTAQKAGFKNGDRLLSLNGQPILSIADIQWVFQAVPAAGGNVKGLVDRAGKALPVTLELENGWRQKEDISWRVSTWGLRRMAFGGMVLENLTPEESKAMGIAPGSMALRARHVGQYGPHAAAQNAGFLKGDVMVSLEGRQDFTSETQLIRYILNAKKSGDKVPVTVLRNGKPKDLKMPVQD